MSRLTNDHTLSRLLNQRNQLQGGQEMKATTPTYQ